MKYIITTIVGDFDVHLSYRPSEDDTILNRLTNAINQFAMNTITEIEEEKKKTEKKTKKKAKADTKTDLEEEKKELLKEVISRMKTREGDVEKALYESTRAPGGAGKRLEFSFFRREIVFTQF